MRPSVSRGRMVYGCAAGVAAVWLACLGPLPAAAASGGEAARPLVLAGSGVALPVTRELVAAFARPDVRIEIPASLGSTGGIRAAAEGAVTVALHARPLRKAEERFGLTVVPYARTPLVLGAHSSVQEDNLTADALVRIVQGEKSRWRDGREIVVLLLYPGDSATEELLSKIPALRQPYTASYDAKRWTFFYNDQLLNETLPRTPGGLGPIPLGSIVTGHFPVKRLAFNGIAPTVENIEAGRYPLELTLRFAFRPETLPAPARAFLTFVRSAAGARILRAHGYLPVP